MDVTAPGSEVRRAAHGPWVDRIGRFGLLAQGVSYVLVGALAVALAVGLGGEATSREGGARDAVRRARWNDHPRPPRLRLPRVRDLAPRPGALRPRRRGRRREGAGQACRAARQGGHLSRADLGDRRARRTRPRGRRQGGGPRDRGRLRLAGRPLARRRGRDRDPRRRRIPGVPRGEPQVHGRDGALQAPHRSRCGSSASAASASSRAGSFSP